MRTTKKNTTKSNFDNYMMNKIFDMISALTLVFFVSMLMITFLIFSLLDTLINWGKHATIILWRNSRWSNKTRQS